MRGIVYHFPLFRALSLQLEAGGDEQDLELPPGVEGGEDGEWVLAQFIVGEVATSIAACIVDRGYGLRLGFEERDWQRLWTFANTHDAPSILPPTVPPPSGDVPTPRDTRVLVVDDDRETQRVLSALLESAGYGTAVAGSAEEAVERLSQLPIELVVLDWMLPRMSGLDLCRALRKDTRYGRLPILFVTARSSSADLVAAFEAGADDFVAKPFRAPELRARILGLLRRAHMLPHAVVSR